MSEDRKTVSNDDYEIGLIAGKLSVPRFVIHLAKAKCKSSDRENIEAWITKNKSLISYLMSDEV